MRLGDYNTSTDEDCVTEESGEEPECAEPLQDIAVKMFIVHPDYSRSTLHHDIGLVRLKEAAKVKQSNIKPICMPFKEGFNKMPEKFVVIGWGRTQDSSGSAILQKASMPLVDQQFCQEKFSKSKVTLIEGQFCAGGEGET